jgi:hypothetical protein
MFSSHRALCSLHCSHIRFACLLTCVAPLSAAVPSPPTLAWSYTPRIRPLASHCGRLLAYCLEGYLTGAPSTSDQVRPTPRVNAPFIAPYAPTRAKPPPASAWRPEGAGTHVAGGALTVSVSARVTRLTPQRWQCRPWWDSVEQTQEDVDGGKRWRASYTQAPRWKETRRQPWSRFNPSLASIPRCCSA